MNHKTSLSTDVDTLKDRLDLALLDIDYLNDFSRTALVALAFCDLLAESLDQRQKGAVEVARQFWAGADSGAHQQHVVEFAKIIHDDQISNTDRHKSAINRLVWTALNTNTKFSAYAAEFLLGLGDAAGLDARQMEQAFAEFVTNF